MDLHWFIASLYIVCYVTFSLSTYVIAKKDKAEPSSFFPNHY